MNEVKMETREIFFADIDIPEGMSDEEFVDRIERSFEKAGILKPTTEETKTLLVKEELLAT